MIRVILVFEEWWQSFPGTIHTWIELEHLNSNVHIQEAMNQKVFPETIHIMKM